LTIVNFEVIEKVKLLTKSIKELILPKDRKLNFIPIFNNVEKSILWIDLIQKE